MGVVFFTGRKPCLTPRLTSEVARALNQGGERSVFVIVPNQTTLETEIMLLNALNLDGSFRLHVLSPERLCKLIFDEAGRPDSARVDERGRVMLVSEVLRRLNTDLKWYSSARARRGFELRAVEQIIAFKQALITPDELSKYADKCAQSALKWKLTDLALIYEAYEQALSGRFQDGEDELNEALCRLRSAPSLAGAELFAFGFDMLTGAFNRLIAGLAGACACVNVFLPLENDRHARDYTLFLPLEQAYERLLACLDEMGVVWERSELFESSAPQNAACHFAREAFCTPVIRYTRPNTSFQLAQLKNPRDEALFAAALTRRLVMTRGWRYSDILILAEDQMAYADVLKDAFDQYEVPLFLPESRPAALCPLPRCLIYTLRLLSGMECDISALFSTGYMDISVSDADRLINYIVRYGLRARDILRPLKRGDVEQIEALEPARARVAESINRLNDALADARTLTEQLTALFDYLTALDAFEKGERERTRLSDMGYRTLAAQDAQVYNRVMGTLDQMHELLGEKKLPKKRLCELITHALEASEVKPLPQSGDAVHLTRASLVGALPFKALIAVGMAERGARDLSGLFSASETRALTETSRRYLGMDALEEVRANRMYLKNALCMATDYLCITYPLSASDDTAERPGALVTEAARVFEGIRARGGVTRDDNVLRMKYSARAAALNMAAAELSAARDGENVSDASKAALCALGQPDNQSSLGALERVRRALKSRVYSETIEPPLAKRVYGALNKLSVTRLEQYARCPFAHFVKYGLSPTIVEPYGVSARDEGAFYHEAVRAFLLDAGAALNDLDAREAVRRMNGVSDLLIESSLNAVFSDTAVSRASAKKLRRAAARAARALAGHMKGSAFTPIELEMEFGDDDMPLKLKDASGARLEGRVDRVDALTEGDTRYLRVIDYKRGSKKLDVSEIYHGLQLQLILYLAAAIHKYGGRSAGTYYFRIDDPILATECRDIDAIERERDDRLRMMGLLPDDMRLINKMSPEPERVFRMRILKSGDMDARTPRASEDEFTLLIERAMALAAQFTGDILNGVTDISPVKSELTDACAYCEYGAVCQTDRQLPGGRKRRVKSLAPDEVMRLLGEQAPETLK